MGQLKALARSLKKRSDVVVTTAKFGRAAPAKALMQAALPAQVAELYSLINGATLEWEFLEDKQQLGSLRIPPLEHVAFSPPSEYYLAQRQDEFSELELACVEEHQPEATTYVARDGRIFFASRSGKDGVVLLAPDLATYLQKGIETAFAWYWMEDSQEARVTRQRLALPATPPKGVDVGARVEITSEMTHYAFHGHGLVKAKAQRLFLVEQDYGGTFWYARKELTAVDEGDAYEARRHDAELMGRLLQLEAEPLAAAICELTEADPDTSFRFDQGLGCTVDPYPTVAQPSHILVGLLWRPERGRELAAALLGMSETLISGAEIPFRAVNALGIVLGALSLCLNRIAVEEALADCLDPLDADAIAAFERGRDVLVSRLVFERNTRPRQIAEAKARYDLQRTPDLAFLGREPTEDHLQKRQYGNRWIDGFRVHH